MRCRACENENPGDARFCTSCGKMLPDSDTSGGLRADQATRGVGLGHRTRESENSLIITHGFAIQGFDETRLSELDASSVSRMSISLAALGVRSPWRTVALMLGVVAAFVAVGAGCMFLMMWLSMPEPVAVASVVEPRDEAIFLGLVVLGLDEGEASDQPAEPVVEVAEPDEPPPATPAKRVKRRPRPVTPPPRSSSTTIEAPPEPEPEPPPSTGGGGTAVERVETMDEYSARVRGLVQVFYGANAQRCFPQGARGTVVVRFTINPDGSVRNPSVARDTTGNPAIGACMVRQIGQWRLSQPPGGRSTLFALTFAQ